MALKSPKKSGALANKVCSLLKGEATPTKYTLASPRRSEQTPPSSGGSMNTNAMSNPSIRTVALDRKSTSKALSVAFEDTGICNMRDRIATRKKKVADAANKQISTTKKKGPKF